MEISGYKGISFPFRLNGQGGLQMSSTTIVDTAHIEESIQQILRTPKKSRIMEPEFGSQISTYLFDQNDTTTQRLIAYEIVEALTEWEPRIKVGYDDVKLTSVGGSIFAELTYTVVSYSLTKTMKLYIGALDEGGVF